MMTAPTLIIETNTVNYLCTVCVSDNNGAKIALTIIISSLALLGLANWAWKKYFANKKEISQQK
tara:strand:- start:60 stop:251 length:192 start_codon:yes stop_codon:yes gene_type:complete